MEVCSGGRALLTPSLPGCHLKMANKSAKFKTLMLFCSFSPWHVTGLSSKRIASKVDVIGPENVLCAGTSVDLSARKFNRLGQRSG